MDDLSTGSESDYSNSWITWFLSTKGNEYFAEVDEDYILDRFNLTGLNGEVVQEYGRALELITDSLAEEELEDDVRESIETSARFLYGLIHARYIVTSRGLGKMMEKYKKADFGRCPRVYCYSQPLLPVGLADVPYQKAVKLYCPRCEDIYSPKSNRHGSIDGAYFGTTFPHMLFMVYPHMIPTKTPPPQHHHQSQHPSSSSNPSNPNNPASTVSGSSAAASAVGSLSTAAVAAKAERYRPKIFGFQVNEVGKLQRWQEAVRDKQIARLEEMEREDGAAMS